MAKSKFIPLTVEELDALLPTYTVTELLSKDRKGAVYKALDPGRNLLVVIKVIAPKISESSLFQDYFQDQLAAIQKLDHPNIVHVFDFGTVEETTYIVSEFIEGNALSKSTKGEAVAPDQAVELILEIAKGLSYAHSQGVTHTDIKPQKIFLNQEAKPLLANFGSFTQIRAATGKPDYGSPKYAARETLSGTFDHRSDIFSLGVVFYELLTGAPPTLPYRNPSEVVPDGPDFDDFMIRALHPNASQRPQNVEQFVEELTAASKRKKSRSPLISSSSIPHQAPPTSNTATVVVQDSGLPVTFLVAALCGVLIGVGVLIFALTRPSGEEVLVPKESLATTGEGQALIGEVATREGSRPETPQTPEPKIELSAYVTSKSLENLAIGPWVRFTGLPRKIRFNVDGTSRNFPRNSYGTWKVTDRKLVVTWNEPAGDRQMVFRIEPDQPNILMGFNAKDELIVRFKREGVTLEN